MATAALTAGALLAPPAAPQPPPPTDRSLGKRKQRDEASLDQPASKRPPLPKQLAEAKKQDRRVTRSSLGGLPAASREGSVENGEGADLGLDLDLKAPILLTTRVLPNLRHHPPPNLVQAVEVQPGPSTAALPGSEVVANDAPRQAQEPERPLFRLLAEDELLPPRGSRHAPAPELDDSDAFYLRLHRYPEVLERRASRLERERLIHERSKLINEIEELRGRTWVYQGTSAGGRAEQERQRRIAEMEDKLARYDVLLPNQPRKSNFLVIGNAAGAAPAPAPASHRRLSPSRTASPAPVPTFKPRANGRATRAHPAAAAPASSTTDNLPPRPSTPLSATVGSGNGTTIRIKFGPPSAPSSPAPSSSTSALPSKPKPRAAPRASDPTLDLDRYTLTGELRKGPKRDRRAERARAEERRKLGLAPRANIDKALYGTKVNKRPPRRGSGRPSYLEDDDDEDEDEEDDEESNDELMEGAEGEEGEGDADVDEWTETDFETGLPVRRRRRAPKLVRKRLPDSFFQSAALRDSLLPTFIYGRPKPPPGGPARPSRRSSSRVAYAFGQRLPDAALLAQAEFEPHGGIADGSSDDDEGYSRTRLEDLVRERMEQKGESVVVLGGRVLPKSALDAWATGPIRFSPTKGSVAGTAALDGASSRAPSPAPAVAAANGHAMLHPHVRTAFAPPSPSPSPAPQHRPPPPVAALPPMHLGMPSSSRPAAPLQAQEQEEDDLAPLSDEELDEADDGVPLEPPMSLAMPGTLPMHVE
ncbi:hypothetical protein JCM10207_008316 [Rhodosporidiobolus poonsookiae]